MRLARVVGNVVSTVREVTHYSRKTMIVEYLDLNLKPIGKRAIAFDAADAGIGDIVIVCIDGGSAMMLFDDKTLIADQMICGVVEEFSNDGVVTKVSGGADVGQA